MRGAARSGYTQGVGRIRIGISGWTYAGWRGDFYPRGLVQRRELEYAAERLTSIEINATYYGRQSAKSWQSWADSVPEGFEFAIKGSRYCVTRPKLAEAGEGLGRYFAQGMSALGTRLGPILWTLSARRQFDREDIAGFFELLLEIFSFVLAYAFFQRRRGFVDHRLGFLEPEAGDGTDHLDHVDFLVPSGHEDDFVGVCHGVIRRICPECAEPATCEPALAHRFPAFEACRWLIDTLKQQVPIWKREHYRDGRTEWVQGAVPPSVPPSVS